MFLHKHTSMLTTGEEKKHPDAEVPRLKKLMPCEMRDVSSWMLPPQVEHKAPMGGGGEEKARRFYCKFIATTNKTTKTHKYDTPKYQVYFERQLCNEVVLKPPIGRAAGTRSYGRDRLPYPSGGNGATSTPLIINL